MNISPQCKSDSVTTSNVTNIRAWARRTIRLPATLSFGDLTLRGSIVDFGKGGLLLALNEANYRQLVIAESKPLVGDVFISFKHVAVDSSYQIPVKIVRHFLSGVGLELQKHDANAYCALLQISNQQGGGIEQDVNDDGHHQMLLRLCRTTLLDYLNLRKEKLFERILVTLQIKLSFAKCEDEVALLQEGVLAHQNKQQKIMNDLFMSLSRQLTSVCLQKQDDSCSPLHKSSDTPQSVLTLSDFPITTGNRYQELLDSIRLKSQQVGIEKNVDITSILNPTKLFETYVNVIEPLALSEEVVICFYQAYELTVLHHLESVYTSILNLLENHLQLN